MPVTPFSFGYGDLIGNLDGCLIATGVAWICKGLVIKWSGSSGAQGALNILHCTASGVLFTICEPQSDPTLGVWFNEETVFDWENINWLIAADLRVYYPTIGDFTDYGMINPMDIVISGTVTT